MKYSPLQEARYQYCPKLPSMLRTDICSIVAKRGTSTESTTDRDAIRELFPNTYGMPMITFEQGQNLQTFDTIRVGVILSGGQAPGGHNVISGLFDALKVLNPASRLIGFKGGPSGILKNDTLEITETLIGEYRNTGGFDIIGSGRTKLETEQQFETCAKVCKQHAIDALVIIGGDDSNTNAAVLAEYFLQKKHPIRVIGCPKTIDGDLKNDSIEVSFGFDTAVKTYSELIGNIERDANSAKKYWHFIKLMGRSASHIALECALQTQPNICLISEEIEQRKMSLEQIVDMIAAAVAKRATLKQNFGVVLIPEGVIEFIPEVKALISELNDLLAQYHEDYGRLVDWESQKSFVGSKLSSRSSQVFSSLPVAICQQLLMDRDPHGNVQVSRIETEKLLAEMVQTRLTAMSTSGTYTGSFSTQTHFFGYEGRCAFPSNFDADYCYSLGYTAAMLIAHGCSGYLSSVTNLTASADQWSSGGVPITMMMNMETRHGQNKPVIKKALVDLEGAPFKYFASHRDDWAVNTSFTYPGAIQYYGPSEVCDRPSITLILERQKRS